MISVSDSAFKRIKELIDIEKSGNEQNLLSSSKNFKGLRISVEAGGCSGFKYKYELTDEIGPDDIVIEEQNLSEENAIPGKVIPSQNIQVYIDSTSAQFIQNSTINFVEDLSGSYFEIKNPNASFKCGCGSSFGI